MGHMKNEVIEQDERELTHWQYMILLTKCKYLIRQIYWNQHDAGGVALTHNIKEAIDMLEQEIKKVEDIII